MTTAGVPSPGAGAATPAPSAGATAETCSVPLPSAGRDGLRRDHNGRPSPASTVPTSVPALPTHLSTHLPTHLSTQSPNNSPIVSSSSSSTRHGVPPVAVLSFADIPPQRAGLDVEPPQRPDPRLATTTTTTTTTTITTITPSKQTPRITQTHTPSPSPSRLSQHSTASVGCYDAVGLSPGDPAPHLPSPASSSSSTPVPNAHPRKPSPGLAARLKALGFGSSSVKAATPPTLLPQPERIGRLPEDQLRQLDEKHQAGSVVPVIERRGRPWKGAGSVVRRIPSVASLAASRSKHKERKEQKENNVHADFDADRERATDSDTASLLLPEIEPAPPLEMDTHKYRLPDHTNGNGTKVQLDTLQQHIDRESPPLVIDTSADLPEIPPPPLPKDTPPLPSSTPAKAYSHPITPPQQDFNTDVASYFNPLGLQRAGSIYTLSRLSFANQLAQLTSIQLPDAGSLASRVSAIPTAQAATRALIGAAEQIRNWVSKASEVIDGLDSDDDVEWAAAGGREGLEEVENAILRFEELINVYVGAIEELQSRADIAGVKAEDLQRAVVQMESILDEWGKMRSTLHSVKAQVEIAMEWEELWSMVLGDIQNEMEELSRLVFEMEERRHQSILATAEGGGVDIGDLETIVEEQQQKQAPKGAVTATRLPTAAGSNRYSIPVFPVSPSSPDPASTTPASISQDDSSLLALFARMQPLRASLDFLPMRLSVFETRASSCFPTACEELEMRRSGLDGGYKKLEQDAESLRKELGEDRWVTVFRGAARQAQKMYESVERSVAKLREALDAGLQYTNQPMMVKKTESYETKKVHYGPAIERVLAIIDKGIKDRLTLNGEILRLYAELQAKWDELRDQMHDVDLGLEEVYAESALRDSISSMLSNDCSTSDNDTPQSSPPSSVIMSMGLDGNRQRSGGGGGGKGDKSTPTSTKRHSVMANSHLPQPATRRSFSSSAAAVAQARKPLRFSNYWGPTTPSGVSTPNREGSMTPVGKRPQSRLARPTPPSDSRPRWNSATTGVDTGHNFKPLSLTTPSPYAKTPPIRRTASLSNTPGSASSATSKLPTPSPLGRSILASSSPGSASASSPSRGSPASGIPYRPRLNSQPAAAAGTANRRVSLQPSFSDLTRSMQRPASSMATTRRNSLLPSVRVTRDLSRPGSRISGHLDGSGRESPQAIAGARFAMRNSVTNEQSRPRWRP